MPESKVLTVGAGQVILDAVAARIAEVDGGDTSALEGRVSDLETSDAEQDTTLGNLQTAVNAKPSINDAVTEAVSVWSSNKTASEIAARIAALVASSPAALDTLDELAAALGDNPNFATDFLTALGNRIRFDAAQALTAEQKAQARANTGAAALSHRHPWADLDNVPATFPPSAHSHTWDSVTSKPSTFPPSAHAHAQSDVTGLVTALNERPKLVTLTQAEYDALATKDAATLYAIV